MTTFFPAGERICTVKEFQPDVIIFRQYSDWDLDSILEFSRQIFVVPECKSSGHYPCQPEIFRIKGANKPHQWCFYITEGAMEVRGEGIYPDVPMARQYMPEMPFYDEGATERVATYTDDERLGNEAWIVGPFDTIDVAKAVWSKHCLKEHSRRWDLAHSEGRAHLAQEMKKCAHAVKAMLVVKAIAEVCPAIATHEIPATLNFCNPEGNSSSICPDPFIVMKKHGDSPTLVGAHPIVEPLTWMLWVVTSEGATAFDTIRLAYYHAVKMSKMGRRFVVAIAKEKEDAIAVFKELMGCVEDKANDEATQHVIYSGLLYNVDVSSSMNTKPPHNEPTERDDEEPSGKEMVAMHPEKIAFLEGLLPTYLVLNAQLKEKAAFWNSFPSKFLAQFPLEKYPAPECKRPALPVTSAEDQNSMPKAQRDSWRKAEKRRNATPEERVIEASISSSVCDYERRISP
ncbi:hypothetical protein V5O48_010631 [Marasmius crinis-equi]|uniref:Uncharacterized protein n=1 Tax=Marasmius crinis-equi TaxID=585013 RepID=A0ABR3F7W4_9AGAR